MDQAGSQDTDRLGTGDAVKVVGPEKVRAVEPTERIVIDVPRQHEPAGVWLSEGSAYLC